MVVPGIVRTCAVAGVAGKRVTRPVENCNGYTQGFVADVDGATYVDIPKIRRRVEGDAFILLSPVVSSRRADRSANDE